MALIGEIVSSPVKTIHPRESIAKASQLMRDENIGAIVVVDDEGGFVGMLTDRDIVIRVTAEGGDARTVTVADVCTRDLTSLEDTADIGEAIDLMRTHLVRRIPVVDRLRRPVGILSIEDVAASEFVSDATFREAFRAIAVAYRSKASHIFHGH